MRRLQRRRPGPASGCWCWRRTTTWLDRCRSRHFAEYDRGFRKSRKQPPGCIDPLPRLQFVDSCGTVARKRAPRFARAQTFRLDLVFLARAPDLALLFERAQGRPPSVELWDAELGADEAPPAVQSIRERIRDEARSCGLLRPGTVAEIYQLSDGAAFLGRNRPRHLRGKAQGDS